ncbi:MAG TPA: asparagine synthase (glutamine-hydrolyzing) [Planctomycetota bacterium]|nr:asparagine synthase (glutamine-hydrolyzing) [Planctomycetota bacterium]
MCGIAGTLAGGPGTVERMLEKIAHRGPDGRAAADGSLSRLGCARLGIRGGDDGAQPLRTKRGLLVFNGEIYNTGELLKDLAWHGVRIDGGSDTQVLGALLDQYGIHAVDRLNGMYAFAWDDGEKVWLARDPVGVKPLYYREGAFASEIAPLLGPGARPCAAAVARWLSFHCAYGEETFFEGVKRVPPGGIVTLPDGRVHRRASPSLAPAPPNPSLDAAMLRKVLARAVRDATPAEPFAVTLSGGIDSTLVAALAKGAKVAFHGRVAEEGCDESAYARAAAEALGIPLREVPVTAEACREALPQVVRAMEEPAAGPGVLGQWIVAREVAREARVLLSGCGGDELFGGYARAAALVHDAPPPGLEAYAPLFARVRGLAGGDRARALLDRRGDALFTREFLDAHPAPGEGIGDAVAAELSITLPALLHVEDRVTMAFGIEGRVPLLDRRLVRSAVRLPAGARVDARGRLKALLRDAAEPLLPEAVRARQDKMGFPLPIGAWCRGPWRDLVMDVCCGARARERGVVDAGKVAAAVEHGGRFDRGIFAALFLELWFRSFLDG